MICNTRAIKFIIVFIVSSLFSPGILYAQYNFKCIVKDRTGNERLQGVTAEVDALMKSIISDKNGVLFLKNLPPGVQKIKLSFVGYNEQIIKVQIPQTDSFTIIYLEASEGKLEEIIVSSSRTDSRIEDLTTKVEVIGSEEMDEEAATIPGNIARLLGDVAGIQSHLSSVTTGNADFRIQGLPGKYTQILRDGLPLFGGYSGSFSILQIPPLDLKQVEFIKGSSSTLYGGGAIAGMINLISKTPQPNRPQRSILINHSTLNETNLNTYFSNRKNNTGYTFFAGTTFQKALDVNKDGFSDVPNVKSFFFHPKLFVYPDARNSLSLGYNGTFDERKGGDMQVLHQKADDLQRFYIENISFRNTLDASWENRLNKTDRLNIKATISFYDRNINTSTFGMKGFQRSFFTEFSYLKKSLKHNLVAGFNFSGERFKKRQPDSSAISNYSYLVSGVFIQDDWKISPALTAQTGLRLDHNSIYRSFLLPRISLLYKINKQFTSRMGGGLGYMAPSVFSSETDERDLKHFALSPFAKPERSQGLNWDINYDQRMDEINLTVNQSFFVARINDPLVIDSTSAIWNYTNAGRAIDTKGFETYVQVKYDELEVYLGYTYTVAKQLYNAVQPFVPLSARSKFAAIISNEFSSRFRACLEASYMGLQWLDDGTKATGYFNSNAMVRYDLKNISLVLNCENIFDYRQTRKESIIIPPTGNPGFKQIWGPIDGRSVNVSARINW